MSACLSFHPSYVLLHPFPSWHCCFPRLRVHTTFLSFSLTLILDLPFLDSFKSVLHAFICCLPPREKPQCPGTPPSSHWLEFIAKASSFISLSHSNFWRGRAPLRARALTVCPVWLTIHMTEINPEFCCIFPGSEPDLGLVLCLKHAPQP